MAEVTPITVKEDAILAINKARKGFTCCRSLTRWSTVVLKVVQVAKHLKENWLVVLR